MCFGKQFFFYLEKNYSMQMPVKQSLVTWSIANSQYLFKEAKWLNVTSSENWVC